MKLDSKIWNKCIHVHQFSIPFLFFTPIKVQNKQLSDLLQDLQTQQRQTHQDFERLKERNQELWRKVGSLRKKHDKQQDTVNRLISFMIHFIQQTPVSYNSSFTFFVQGGG